MSAVTVGHVCDGKQGVQASFFPSSVPEPQDFYNTTLLALSPFLFIWPGLKRGPLPPTPAPLPG